ncbi:MAG: isocitrate/isopropylmalate dehydrogenase family protein [Synergistaceae bacterium]|nr:isocitrate/isopropylmalate dehydrogenase family protein [Synergistaceae bacterium]
MHSAVYIPGDGIGPEVVDAAKRVVDATGVDVEWISADAGQSAIEAHGTTIPSETLDVIRRVRVALKGPFTNLPTGFPSPNQTLRTELELFGNLRLARAFAGVATPFQGIDLAVVRECTEGLFAGTEQMVGKDAAVVVRPTSRFACERVVRFAFDFAVQNNRKKVTVALKANILKLTDGMFLKAAREISTSYPNVQLQSVNIDALCMDLVRKPQEFDVLVMPNAYGDIVADIAGGLVGSLGLCPGGNYGENLAVFESAHGSAPKYAGQNKVNPTAMILSGAMMLRHLGEAKAAEKIENAARKVIAEGRSVTYDLGGKASTSEMTDAIIERLK